MYIRLFTSIFSGSLYGQFEPTVTFIAMLALADRNGEVDMVPEAIACKSGFPLHIIEAGITELEKPDPRSRIDSFDGRRILRIDEHRSWGWRITNFAEYQKIRTAEERREYFREYKAAKRAKSGQSQCPPRSTPLDASSSSISTSTSGKESEVAHAPSPPPSKQKAKLATRIPEGWQPSPDLIAYAEKELPNVDTAKLAESFADYWQAAAGAKARKLDWDATWRTWVRRSCDRYPTKTQSRAMSPQIRIDANGRQISG